MNDADKALIAGRIGLQLKKDHPFFSKVVNHRVIFATAFGLAESDLDSLGVSITELSLSDGSIFLAGNPPEGVSPQEAAGAIDAYRRLRG